MSIVSIEINFRPGMLLPFKEKQFRMNNMTTEELEPSLAGAGISEQFQLKASGRSNLFRLLNLTICSFGIQFGSALQMANMSSIYKFLGASAGSLTILWLAGPVTGLLVQPVIGHLSDSSRSRFGRRRPYILLMAVLAFISLVLMPNSSAIWMAAALLWLLDTSNNGVTLPFRAMISEQSTRENRTLAFALQAAFSGAGATIAAILPWVMLHVFHVQAILTSHQDIPTSIKLSFYIGAAVFLLTAIWTVVTTKEKPVEYTEPREPRGPLLKQAGSGLKHLWINVKEMPLCIRELYWVQMFTWFGLFCMWLYFSLGVAQNIFGLPPGATVKGNAHLAYLLEQGTVWTGIAFATYQFVSFIYALSISKVSKKIGLKASYALSLLCGGGGLIIAASAHQLWVLLLAMIGVGITWGAIVCLPYTMLSLQLPKKKMALYLGLFNLTICIPQLICALVLAPLVQDVFHNRAMSLIMLGGISLCLAAVLMWRKRNPRLLPEA